MMFFQFRRFGFFKIFSIDLKNTKFASRVCDCFPEIDGLVQVSSFYLNWVFRFPGFYGEDCCDRVSFAAASSAVLVDDNVFDCMPVRGSFVGKILSDDNVVDSRLGGGDDVLGEIVVPGKRVIRPGGLKLFVMVSRVIKTLSWHAARRVIFEKAVEKYGFTKSIDSFRIIVHVYAVAHMESEVSALLRDILEYYQSSNRDLFSLYTDIVASCSTTSSSDILVDTLMKVVASNKMLDHAINVFVQSKMLGVTPSIKSCNFLLKCLGEANKGENLLNMFDKIQKFGPAPNAYTYTIVLNFYCKGQAVDIGKAICIFKEMEKKGVEPTVVTYSTLISGLCEAGRLEDAIEFINDMRCTKQPLNSYCYNHVMRGFCLKGEPHEALSILEDMKSYGVAPDMYSYGVLINGFCRIGNLEKGLDLIAEMESNNLKPSLACYGPLLKGISDDGLIDISLDVYNNLKNFGYQCDQHVYNIMIRGCCLQADFKSACQILEEMISNTTTPDALNCRNLIPCFSKMGFVDKAREYYNILLERDILPDLRSCNSIVQAYCYQGRVGEALQFMGEMCECGIAPNCYTYNAVINRLCKEGHPKRALELFPVMLKVNVYPNVQIYSTLLDGFTKQKNFKKPFALYAKMLIAGVTPDRITYTILINAFCQRQKMHKACILMNEMMRKGFIPDLKSYTSVISGFCKTGNMKKAWEVYNKMLQRGWDIWIELMSCSVKWGRRVSSQTLVSIRCST
ncbi:pentatricopeptide repeat-containing protein At1g62914, mitochondrial isoform X2 [Daucus carota subsp. sativus]|uniref:pentatricopeptide repeat-containing protein At1g62914, mitochondrial isoform X2 n=1 Tax=Daucus carota subsp. sativus TaxID=79200 RepID=UPI003083DA1E